MTQEAMSLLNSVSCFLKHEEKQPCLGERGEEGREEISRKAYFSWNGTHRGPLQREAPSWSFPHLLLPARPSACSSPVSLLQRQPCPTHLPDSSTPVRCCHASSQHSVPDLSSSTSIFFALCSPHSPYLAYIFIQCSNLFIPSFLFHCVDSSGPIFISAQP